MAIRQVNLFAYNDCRALRGSLASLLAEGYRAKRVLDAVRVAAVSGTREARQSLERKERSGLRSNDGCFTLGLRSVGICGMGKLALKHLLVVCVGSVRLPVSFSSFLFFVRGGYLIVNNFIWWLRNLYVSLPYNN